MGLRSSQKQRCQTDLLDHGYGEDTEKTLSHMYDNQAFEMEQVWDDNSAECPTIEMTISSPPAKPQRSFRHKQQQQETDAYLEGCGHVKEEERRMEEVAGRSLEERNKGCHRETEEEEKRGFYLLEDGGSQTETDEQCNEEGEEKDRRESREEKKEWRQEREVEEAGEQESGSTEGEGRGNKEKRRDEKREEEEGDGEQKREKDGETNVCSEDNETGSKKQDTGKSGIIAGGEPASSLPSLGRRSRVIRLYQYDDDGQRYCHLPDPAPDETGPAPRLKQRSVSLTRLNAIMAAASTGPLDTTETGGEERPHFHMEI